MKIFVSAAEISSDIQAEAILKNLIQQFPEKEITLFGIGGPKLRALKGFQCIEPAENLRTMGFLEVISKLLYFKRLKNKVLHTLKKEGPDVIMTFDYPDFHFSLMKSVKKIPELRNALKICGIPPKVWVWRAHRVSKIRDLYHGVWVIFPFEKDFYDLHGIPVIYEGNPLIADVIEKYPENKRPLETESEVNLAVFPGSRAAELRYHLPIIHPALVLLSKRTGKTISAQVPIPDGVEDELVRAMLRDCSEVRYEFFKNQSGRVLANNALGIIKSGTSTLEAVVLSCVPVIFYKMNGLTEWLFKTFVRYSGPVGLPNILLNIKNRADSVFPELLGAEANPERISSVFYDLLVNHKKLTHITETGRTLRQSLVFNGRVAEHVAIKLRDWILFPPRSKSVVTKSFFILIISMLWSSLNFLRRAVSKIFPPEPLPIASILVGNLQAGGTGKTPVVMSLIKEGLRRGFRVGVISRGYGGAFKGALHEVKTTDVAEWVGDEPLEIKMKFPNVPVIVSRDRVLAAKKLKDSQVNLVILDDGFQNLKFRATKNLILLTDLTPAQVLHRDFYSELKNADLVIQSKGNKLVGSTLPQIQWRCLTEVPSIPIWILVGVGDPSELVFYYSTLGFKIIRTIVLPDHESLPLPSVKKLIDEAKSAGVRLALTTKDLVKLPSEIHGEFLLFEREISNPEVFDPLFDRLQ